MLNFSMPELVMILVIALIVFGPGKLPEVGKSLGKSLSEFRRSMDTNSSEPVKVEAKTLEQETIDHGDQAKKG